MVGDEKISIKELVSEIITLSQKNPKIDIIKKTTPNRDLVFDNSKMRDLLCIPNVGLKDGLLKTLNWIEQNINIIKKQPDKYKHKKWGYS